VQQSGINTCISFAQFSLANVLSAFSLHWVAQNFNISLGCEPELSNQMGRSSALLCNSLESTPVCLLHNFALANVLSAVSLHWFAQNFNISLGCEPELSNQMGRPSALLCNSLESTPVCLLHNFALANVLSAFSLHWVCAKLQHFTRLRTRTIQSKFSFVQQS
jgi:wyosine [tRNA(Phe)-imidazoG37] synthetase (radical SAM superfamily)